ncbi:branched-chain amino acid ABC transporter permease [Roseitranquillus sediminis]|uniref:branched-chain amino acid ABC transporter permease n=1 Tax=Roseitranquillus sediminis TaxID=2809051 RepID=UPI001D0CD082|nr:branched-chain amino acid ABC transporter permease [Roseitranquillus sediminis]MBM9594871.1 branched-chain amino acid ABC transporter permease [Roseitranquillus sediminis]
MTAAAVQAPARRWSREARVNTALSLGLLAVPLLAMAAGEPFWVTLATRAAILALAGVGLNLALGYGGLVSFGHAAFFGLGGYAAGVLASHGMSGRPIVTWPLEIGGTTQMLAIWPVAVAAAALGALVIGALSLRTTGVFFIMITLAFGQMAFYFMVSWPAYGGEDGLPTYVRSRFPGVNTMAPLQFFAIAYGWLMLALWLSWRIAGSRLGLALQAARQNRQRLAAVGIRPKSVLLGAFVLSGALTGLAGALYTDLNRFVSPAMLSWQTSGELLVLVILGGVGRLFGPVAGAMLFIALEHLLGGISDYWQFFLGAMLLMVVLFARGGIMGALAGRDG